MNKLKIYTRSYGIILMMLFMALVFGIAAGVVAGVKECYTYWIEQPKPQIEEILSMMKEELKNVD